MNQIKSGIILVAMFFTVTTFSFAIPVTQDKESSKEARQRAKLEREAKITMEQAREIALQRAPGTVESGELEREHRQLVYSFDIRTATDITEVQVNAITGKIARVEHENPKKEAAEKRKEEREKRQNKNK
ncbi:MAG: PepSY domain-containing protein [Pyrinomonadaceae bacterium]